MRYDKDLHFLAECRREDLRTLADYLTHDAKGEIRMSEQLTDTLAYVRNYPDNMHGLWREIAGELQRYGGNTIVNCFRQQGVCYHVILKDVCKKMHVPYSNNTSTEWIEQHLLQKIFMDAVEKMNVQELQELVETLDIPVKNFKTQFVVAAFQVALRKGGNVLGARMAVYVAHILSRMMLGRGLFFIGSNAVGKTASLLTGPLGWALTAGWTIYDLSSPAYRVTIPCVIQIAYMRSVYKSTDLKHLTA